MRAPLRATGAHLHRKGRALLERSAVPRAHRTPVAGAAGCIAAMEVEECVLRANPQRTVEPRLGLGAPPGARERPADRVVAVDRGPARHGRGERDEPFPPAGCGGRPGRPRSRGRRAARSRPAPGRWPRRPLARAPPPSSDPAGRAGRRATRRTAGAGRRSPPAVPPRPRRRADLERRRPGPSARARGRSRGRSRAPRARARAAASTRPSPSASFASSTCAHAVGSGTPPAASSARFIAAAAPRRSPRQLTRVGDTGVGGEARLHGRHPVELRECLRVAPELDQGVTHHAVGPRRERRTEPCLATEGERPAKVVTDQREVAEPQRRGRVPRPCVRSARRSARSERGRNEGSPVSRQRSW